MSKYLFLFVIISLTSCTKNKYEMVDELIEKYDTVNFGVFKNSCIYHRYGSVMLSKKDKCGPYIIKDYNKAQPVINKELVLNSCSDYLSEDSIKYFTHKYLTYKLGYLSVDSLNNVYLSPYEHGALLVKVKDTTMIPQGFMLYKKNWAVNKTVLESLR